jgi:membrane associated rhomboid family serine protease
MNWINKMERRFGKYAIKNLMLYIIALYVLGIIINIWTPLVYDTYLALDAQKILQGQVWRIVTFIIQPPSNTNIIFLIFVLYFYYMIGTVLENIWGAFRFNLYFFTGIIFHVIAAFIIYFAFGINYHMSTYYINLALFKYNNIIP